MELGSIVKLVYKGTLEDGSEFGYADAAHPMEFQTGMELTIDGFEEEIMKLEKAGDKVTFTVDKYNAYGERLDDMTQTLPRESVPINPKEGQRIWMLDDDGGKMPATVLEINDEGIKVDINHPLAGHDLTFEVEILEVTPPPENFVSAAELKAEQDRLKKMLGQ